MKRPTGEEMMHHFNKHKTDFEMIRQVIAEDTISAFDYPPILVEEKYKKCKGFYLFQSIEYKQKEKIGFLATKYTV